LSQEVSIAPVGKSAVPLLDDAMVLAKMDVAPVESRLGDHLVTVTKKDEVDLVRRYARADVFDFDEGPTIAVGRPCLAENLWDVGGGGHLVGEFGLSHLPSSYSR